MNLPSRRSFAEARIRLGSFDRFLLLYGAMFAAFGVASPFLPALLHQRGLGPSEIGAVLAAGNRYPTDHQHADFALCGSTRQAPANPNRAARPGRSHRVSPIRFRPASRSSSLSVSHMLL